jgi:hypothetical protein
MGIPLFAGDTYVEIAANYFLDHLFLVRIGYRQPATGSGNHARSCHNSQLNQFDTNVDHELAFKTKIQDGLL